MNIYLASGYNRRELLRDLAEKLEAKGHHVCSEWIWLDARPDRDTEDWDKFAVNIALSNLKDLRRAEAIVIDAYGINPTNNGGVHTELGFAIAKHFDIYLVGSKGNTFHWLPDIKNVRDYEELLKLI